MGRYIGTVVLDLRDDAKRPGVPGRMRILLGELILEVVAVPVDVVMAYRRPGEDQGRVALSVVVANGVDEELEVLIAKFVGRGAMEIMKLYDKLPSGKKRGVRENCPKLLLRSLSKCT